MGLKPRSTIFYAVAFLVLIATVTQTGLTAELEEGKILNASNVEDHLDDTFNGESIETLLNVYRDGDAEKTDVNLATDFYTHLMKNYNLRMSLQEHHTYRLDSEFYEETDGHADEVKYNPETRLVENYRVGWPFPWEDLEEGETGLGDKIFYNAFYGIPSGQIKDMFLSVLSIDKSNGLERESRATFETLNHYGKFSGEGHDHVLGPDETSDIHREVLLFFTHPQDVQGLGTFTRQYAPHTGRVESSWAYLRSLRRTRRVSGGNWMNKGSAGTDAFNDEQTRRPPYYYPEIKYLGKRTILLPMPKGGVWVDVPVKRNAGSAEGRYPFVEFDKEPHWNFDPEHIAYEPREVWVVHATMPDEHPLKARTYFIDPETGGRLLMIDYDKSGNLWQYVQYIYMSVQNDNGDVGVIEYAITWNDLKAGHATISGQISPDFEPPEISPDDIGLFQLRRGEPITRVTGQLEAPDPDDIDY